MVCSVSKVTKGSERYYTDLAREDYYTAGGEPPGRFLGSGAKSLGLDSVIRHKDERLHALFQGINPNDGSVLRKGASTERIYRDKDGTEKVHQPVCAYDFTLSAPKSVSVLWALSDRETRTIIGAAHERAVTEAAHHLEKNGCVTRTGSGGQSRERVKPIFAAFQHSTSRELDPQLHTHLLLINTGIREDGRGGSLDARELFRRQFIAGQIYRDTLRYQLSKELHLQVTDVELKKGRSFEIKGVPEALCREFSKRRQQIEQLISKEDTPKQVQMKVLATRPRKLRQLNREDLFRAWREVGREAGFNAEQFVKRAREQHYFREADKYLNAIAKAHEQRTYKERVAARRSAIDAAFEKAQSRAGLEQRRFQRKMLFLYATGKISRSTYLRVTEGKGLPTTKLGINVAYATHQISRKQQQYLLSKHGHISREEWLKSQPKTELGINLAYATYQISERQRLSLLRERGYLSQPSPPQRRTERESERER